MRGDDDNVVDWRDKYERLRDAHVDLKKKHGDLQDELKQQGTRIRSSLSLEVVDGKSEHGIVYSSVAQRQPVAHIEMPRVGTAPCSGMSTMQILRRSPHRAAHDKLVNPSSNMLELLLYLPPSWTQLPKSIHKSHRSLIMPTYIPTLAALISALNAQLREMDVDLTRLTSENEMLLRVQHQQEHHHDIPRASHDEAQSSPRSRVASAHVTLLEVRNASPVH
ncbi:hypothetical protein AaE_004101 [Aphanomyces astaci]|uniref:Uncharacterized protein n=1 Tax=Aphanomyces astaci TaxID=112090 RepID=A0A6A5AK66_APHAT|nr:hypothetical protein AaE_004101 [Aphanomyces astaci]